LKLNPGFETWDIYGVAPFTGAWIETRQLTGPPVDRPVAPFTGAWIETSTIYPFAAQSASRPLHGGVD